MVKLNILFAIRVVIDRVVINVAYTMAKNIIINLSMPSGPIISMNLGYRRKSDQRTLKSSLLQMAISCWNYILFVLD